MHDNLLNVIIKSLEEKPEEWDFKGANVYRKDLIITIKQDYNSQKEYCKFKDVPSGASICKPNGVHLSEAQRERLAKVIAKKHDEIIEQSLASRDFQCKDNKIIFGTGWEFLFGYNSHSSFHGNISEVTKKYYAEKIAKTILSMIKDKEFSWIGKDRIKVNGVDLNIYYSNSWKSENRCVSCDFYDFKDKKAEEIFKVIEEDYTEEILNCLKVFLKEANPQKGELKDKDDFKEVIEIITEFPITTFIYVFLITTILLCLVYFVM